MKTRTVLDGNAFYEIDEECLEKTKRGKGSTGEKEKNTRTEIEKKDNQKK